tara:strand:- start:274 stop:561 length:288 start_codon:yes stop_codon:yes gene_type:complete
MKNVNIKLRNIKSTPCRKEKEDLAYDTLKYVYINRIVFDSTISNLFLKTVLKKALYFYKKNNCKKFYEWVFKFRNYIKLLDRNFILDDIESFYLI